MQRPIPRALITKTELKDWLRVSDYWVRDRLENDSDFVTRCVVDLAPRGSDRRTLRWNVDATAAHLGIPLPPSAATTYAPSSIAA